MTTLAPIAAVLADGEDMFNVVFLLIFIVIGIIASIAKKVMEKKKQEQRERERAEQAAQAPRQPQPPAPRRPQRLRPQPQQYSPIATAEVAEPLGTLGAGVAGEVQRLQQQQAAAERQRAARMAARTPLEADTAAIERRLVSVGRRRGRRSAGTVTAASSTGPKVSLHSRTAARRAIVYFEIFSPPKALRKGGEMWDV